jgi:Domain of unknown function (DUF4905)
LDFKPFFAFEFGAKIWRLVPDSSANTLVVELRDAKNREVNFVSLSLDNGEIMAQGLNMPSGWWYGIEAVVHNTIILHSYPNWQMPNHEDLIAFNAQSGEKLWELPGHTFSSFKGNQIFTHNRCLPVPGEGCFNLLTGQPDEPRFHEEIKSGIIPLVPVLFGKDAPYYDEIALFINQVLGHNHKFEMQFEYLETPNIVAISYYLRQEGNGSALTGSLNRYLLICNNRGQLLLHKNTDTSLPGIGEGSFFVFNSIFIFVENTSNLYGYTTV